MLNAVSHQSMESIFFHFDWDSETAMAKPSLPQEDWKETRKLSSWPSTFPRKSELKSMYSPLLMELIVFSGRCQCPLKICTRRVQVSTARESEMCYSLGTSIGDVTRLSCGKRCAIFVVSWWFANTRSRPERPN